MRLKKLALIGLPTFGLFALTGGVTPPLANPQMPKLDFAPVAMLSKLMVLEYPATTLLLLGSLGWLLKEIVSRPKPRHQ